MTATQNYPIVATALWSGDYTTIGGTKFRKKKQKKKR
jgi:hypothetical protein